MMPTVRVGTGAAHIAPEKGTEVIKLQASQSYEYVA